MILTALYELYQRLVCEPSSGIVGRGYSMASVVLALEIDVQGRVVAAVPLGTQKGSRTVGLPLAVPERVKRTSGDTPNFLCDNGEYIIGIKGEAEEPGERSLIRKRLCLELHRKILGDLDDEGARAVLAFLARPTTDLLCDPKIREQRPVFDKGGNIVFRLAGDTTYVHQRPAIREAWEAYKAIPDPAQDTGQCLITGRFGPIATLHMSTSGIADVKSFAPSLVSFNIPAATSYGKIQGANSPVSQKAAFGYGTALNWLTSSERHCVRVGDTTVVFWAERAGPEEDLLLQVFGDTFGYSGGDGDSSATPSVEGVNDEIEAQKMKGAIQRLFQGQLPVQDNAGLDDTVRFYILGLAPNAARLSVRFWNVDTLGVVLENVRQHFEDMLIEHSSNDKPISAYRLIMELTSPKSRKSESLPKVLIGSFLRAVLTGAAYPQSMYSLMISRIKVDANDPDRPRLEQKLCYPRVAYLKAHLVRNARIHGHGGREGVLTEVLNTENQDPGYLLGRLFAILEKAQQDANPEIKATIKDRYYASASSAPGSVFPVLLRLVQHHIGKAKYGALTDKRIEEVMAGMTDFPKYLSLEQQGLFAIGYYQQRRALFTSTTDKEKGGEDNVESDK